MRLLICFLLQLLSPRRALHVPRISRLHAVYPIDGDAVKLDQEDPYLSQKQKLLKSSFQYAEDLSLALPKILGDENEDALRTSLYLALWACCFEHQGMPIPRQAASSVYKQLPVLLDNIRENHMERLVTFLLEMLSSRADTGTDMRSKDNYVGSNDSNIVIDEISIVTSSVGSGLFADLLLGHIFLSLDVCDRIRYITRRVPHQGGVLIKDVLGAIGILSDPTSSDVWAIRHFGDALSKHITDGRILLDEGVYIYSDKDECTNTALLELDLGKIDESCKLLLLMGQEAWNSAEVIESGAETRIGEPLSLNERWQASEFKGNSPPVIFAMKVDDDFDIDDQCADAIFL